MISTGAVSGTGTGQGPYSSQDVVPVREAVWAA